MRTLACLQLLAWAVILGGAILGSACSRSADPAQNSTLPVAEAPWSTYSGTWFTVEYPSSFKASPSLTSNDSDGYDSVFFKSPDGRASYYVLSPQWARAASDIAFDATHEIEIGNHSQEDGGRRTFTRIIHANDDSYTRELTEHSEQDGTVYWVLQFRYADAATRAEHVGGYQRFKASLQQYSD